MEGMLISSNYKKHSLRDIFKMNAFKRITLLLFGFVIYMFFISPKTESLILDLIRDNVRYKDQVTLNFLTPIHDNAVYAQEYNLNTLSTKNSLKNVRSITDIQTKDVRIIAMEKFLADYSSPMTQSAHVFIEQADNYGLDWRLVASISGVESAFGNISPTGSNNGWGWRGINKNPEGWSMFATWGDGITEVTRGLAQGYGVTLSPFQIEPSYCPPCAENPAHAWANGVTRFMNELTYYVNNLDKID